MHTKNFSFNVLHLSHTKRWHFRTDLQTLFNKVIWIQKEQKAFKRSSEQTFWAVLCICLVLRFFWPLFFKGFCLMFMFFIFIVTLWPRSSDTQIRDKWKLWITTVIIFSLFTFNKTAAELFPFSTLPHAARQLPSHWRLTWISRTTGYGLHVPTLKEIRRPTSSLRIPPPYLTSVLSFEGSWDWLRVYFSKLRITAFVLCDDGMFNSLDRQIRSSLRLLSPCPFITLSMNRVWRK